MKVYKMSEMNTYKGVVIYTDGGAIPNPGNAGWGAHGYIYNEAIADSKNIVINKTHVPTKIGYTHQCELGQNDRSITVTPVLYLDGFGTCRNNSSNNVAEIDAFYNIIKYMVQYNIEEMQLLTDSQYLKNGLTIWRAAWEASNFYKPDGNLIANKDLWVLIYNTLDKLINNNVKFTVDWVKGHNDILGNVLADELATIGVLSKSMGYSLCEIRESPVKNYWKSDVNKNPLIDHKRLYFNSQSQYNSPGKYYLANPGKDEKLLGKKTPATSYSVIKLTIPDNEIETVIRKQCKVAEDNNFIIMLRLDKLFMPTVHKRITEYGDIVLNSNNKRSIGLNYIDGSSITEEVNPTGLSYKALDALAFLEHKLETFISNNHLNNNISYDITEFLYDVNIKGNKLKSEIGVGIFNIDISIDYRLENNSIKKIPITLILGSDILNRNGLKKIETSNVKVTLLLWRVSEYTLKYAVIITTDIGVGIWCNYYSNDILI
jgi:ribonuclease HI